MKHFRRPFLLSLIFHVFILLCLSTLPHEAKTKIAAPKVMTLRLVSLSSEGKGASASSPVPQKEKGENAQTEKKKEVPVTKKKDTTPKKKEAPEPKTFSKTRKNNNVLTEDKQSTQEGNMQSANISTKSSTTSFSELSGGNSGHARKQANTLFDVSSLVVKRKVHPQYPLLSRRKGEEGKIICIADVENGKVVAVNTEQSSGFNRLDRAATQALKAWLFEESFTGKVRVPISFSLKE
jgi:protein TonB